MKPKHVFLCLLATSLASAFFWGCTASQSIGSSCSGDADCPPGYGCDQGMCAPSGQNPPGNAGDDDELPGGGNDDDDDGTTPIATDDDDDDPFAPADLEGPSIEIVFPKPLQLVRGGIVIRAAIEDISGVNIDSVYAKISASFIVPMQQYDAGLYAGQFDTGLLGALLLPSIEITASDTLGNFSTVGHSFTLDNEPPVAALYSPKLQETRDGNNGPECSWAYQPLGQIYLQHGELYEWPYLFIFPRARIEDFGNGGTISYMAGVEQESVRLYMLDSIGIAAGVKLVTGPANAARCDRIAPVALPDPVQRQPEQAFVHDMAPIPTAGEANFTPHPDDANFACTNSGSATLPPKLLCDGSSDVAFWPSYTHNKTPMIYTLVPYLANDPVACRGTPFDVRNFGADGPVCLAVAARDNLGNRTVSMPIAVCVDHDGQGGECDDFDANAVAAGCVDQCWAADFGEDEGPDE